MKLKGAFLLHKSLTDIVIVHIYTSVPSAQRRCNPTGRCIYRPSVIYDCQQISLSLSLSLSLCLIRIRCGHGATLVCQHPLPSCIQSGGKHSASRSTNLATGQHQRMHARTRPHVHTHTNAPHTHTHIHIHTHIHTCNAHRSFEHVSDTGRVCECACVCARVCSSCWVCGRVGTFSYPCTHAYTYDRSEVTPTPTSRGEHRKTSLSNFPGKVMP